MTSCCCFGDRTEGNYLLEWYVCTGRQTGLQLPEFQDNPGESQFGMPGGILDDGTVTLDAGAADVVTFNWTPDTWMHFQHFIDTDNNWITFIVDGNADLRMASASWTTFTTTGAKQIGSVDFFGNDNVFFTWMTSSSSSCPLPGNLCGGSQNIQNAFGQDREYGFRRCTYDNTNYTTTSRDLASVGNASTSLMAALLLAWSAPWFTFVGDSNDYGVTAAPCGDNPIGDGDTQLAVYSGGCGSLTAVVCNDDDPTLPISALRLISPRRRHLHMMVDGFSTTSSNSAECCLEVTQIAKTS